MEMTTTTTATTATASPATATTNEPEAVAEAVAVEETEESVEIESGEADEADEIKEEEEQTQQTQQTEQTEQQQTTEEEQQQEIEEEQPEQHEQQPIEARTEQTEEQADAPQPPEVAIVDVEQQPPPQTLPELLARAGNGRNTPIVLPGGCQTCGYRTCRCTELQATAHAMAAATLLMGNHADALRLHDYANAFGDISSADQPPSWRDGSFTCADHKVIANGCTNLGSNMFLKNGMFYHSSRPELALAYQGKKAPLASGALLSQGVFNVLIVLVSDAQHFRELFSLHGQNAAYIAYQGNKDDLNGINDEAAQIAIARIAAAAAAGHGADEGDGLENQDTADGMDAFADYASDHSSDLDAFDSDLEDSHHLGLSYSAEADDEDVIVSDIDYNHDDSVAANGGNKDDDDDDDNVAGPAPKKTKLSTDTLD